MTAKIVSARVQLALMEWRTQSVRQDLAARGSSEEAAPCPFQCTTPTTQGQRVQRVWCEEHPRSMKPNYPS